MHSRANFHYQRALVADPCNIEAIEGLTNLFIRQSKGHEAVKFLREKCKTSHSEVLAVLLGDLLLDAASDRGQVEEARRWFEHALKYGFHLSVCIRFIAAVLILALQRESILNDSQERVGKGGTDFEWTGRIRRAGRSTKSAHG